MTFAEQWECQLLMVRSYALLDEGDYRALAALFAPDGIWHRQGQARRGREAIVAALADRPPKQRVLHVVSNERVTLRMDSEADSTCYLTVYRHDAADAGAPCVVHGPIGVFVVNDRLARTDEGWRIAERRQSMEFSFAAP